ncbi:MAG: Bifunctional enzyme IspD/IspF [bacterium]|nr:Bifunctional enzyme IspD/IspF [bacterium]
MRIGLGIDLHRLIHDPSRPLLLGGVEIPGDLALEGHSDADALLHALTDAILGALGLGDIGEYFPNTDPRWKNADSQRFLEHALVAMRQRGYVVCNIDACIVAEAPKLMPYRSAIRARLADLLQVEPEAVGLKATTAEQLGSLGRGEGLCAQVVVLLEQEEKPVPPALKTAADATEARKKTAAKKSSASKTAIPEATINPASVMGKVIQVWADGASRGNPGPASIGVILKTPEGGVIHTASQRVGEVTNNVAEYRALIYALQIGSAMMPSRLEVMMDSELVVKQMKGEYRVKDETLQGLYRQAKVAESSLDTVTYRHVPREQNKEADALANLALDS